MNIQRDTSKVVEFPVLLGTVQAGSVVRFANVSFDEALRDDAFYIKLDTPELKETARLVNPKDGKCIMRDGTHAVVIHQATLSIV